ncbi:hypothetical protein FGB62_172g010 [Gracilaria domingensis]|nr:hypothetical protein FGB62_172g010 [Gracilaria domingensis]
MSGWEPGPILPAKVTLCRDDLPSPFTVVCIPPEDQSPVWAKFFVNGNFFRNERVLPYVMTGDTFNAGAAAWIPDLDVYHVKCRLSTGDVVSSTITFSCSDDDTITVPPTTTSTTTLPPTTTTATTSTTLPPTTTTATTSTTLPPTTTTATTSTTLPPTTTLPATTTTTTTLPPATTTSISTTTTTTATTLPPATTMATTLPPTTTAIVPPTDYCIYIPALTYNKTRDEDERRDWEEAEDSMQYKFDDDRTRTDPAGRATLRYSFTPLYTARYALTLDMFTSDKLDHNDVWLQIVSVPFTLVSKTGTIMDGKQNFNKAYHNKNGRGKIVFTSDFDPHVFTVQLQAGETYEVQVGGRSTKVALYGVILFPCEAFGCQLVREWYRSANTCSA